MGKNAVPWSPHYAIDYESTRIFSGNSTTVEQFAKGHPSDALHSEVLSMRING
jgi:hypothetical protein